MDRYSLEHLADDSLLDGLHALAERDHETTADLLAHIAEVSRRRLYAQLGYPSMKSYCVRVLHLSESSASKHIQVARKALAFPVIFEALAGGRVHLAGMNLLAPFLDDENVHDLLAAATHRTKAEIELLLAERFPRPEPEEAVEELPAGEADSPRHRSGVRPIAPGRYLVQFAIGEADLERLQYALQLMSHRNPRGNLAFLNREAIEALIENLEAEKFGATDRPREGEGSSTGRHIPRAVKRRVWERDGGRCSYVSPSGRRCECRWMLEFDHVREFARGGDATADNVRLLCRTHNQHAAELTYGRSFMERKRSGAADVNFVNAPGHLGADPREECLVGGPGAASGMRAG